jgi:hypothetical protein
MDLVLQTTQNLGDAAVKMMQKLEPGRPDLIFVALTLQLIQLTGALYGQRAALKLKNVIEEINRDNTVHLPSA